MLSSNKNFRGIPIYRTNWKGSEETDRAEFEKQWSIHGPCWLVHRGLEFLLCLIWAWSEAGSIWPIYFEETDQACDFMGKPEPPYCVSRSAEGCWENVQDWAPLKPENPVLEEYRCQGLCMDCWMFSLPCVSWSCSFFQEKGSGIWKCLSISILWPVMAGFWWMVWEAAQLIAK